MPEQDAHASEASQDAAGWHDRDTSRLGYRDTMRDGLLQAPSHREIARMSRLAPLDKVLLVILVPLWLVCFGLSVRTQLRGDVIAGIGVSASADPRGYPTLTGEFSSYVYPSSPLRVPGRAHLGVEAVGFANRHRSDAPRSDPRGTR